MAWDFPRGVAGVTLLAEWAAERGLPRAEVLRGSGLDGATLRDPHADVAARQELAVVRNLVAHCARHGADPAALGWELGCRYHATAYGIWGFAVTSSRTVGDALTLALRYVELTYAFCLPESRRAGDAVVLRCDTTAVPADVRPFLLARDVSACRTLVSELLGIAPEHDLRHGTVSLPAALLARRMPQANASTAAVCEQQCRELLAARRQRGGTAARVRERLLADDGPPAGMPAVAAELGVTARTLRRRLAAEGTAYRALADEVRRARAEELLADRALTVEQVAHRLGYGEAASFVRAFTRWTGTTPGRYTRSRGDVTVRRA